MTIAAPPLPVRHRPSLERSDADGSRGARDAAAECSGRERTVFETGGDAERGAWAEGRAPGVLCEAPSPGTIVDFAVFPAIMRSSTTSVGVLDGNVAAPRGLVVGVTGMESQWSREASPHLRPAADDLTSEIRERQEGTAA